MKTIKALLLTLLISPLLLTPVVAADMYLLMVWYKLRGDDTNYYITFPYPFQALEYCEELAVAGKEKYKAEQGAVSTNHKCYQITNPDDIEDSI